jgi:hypothetical protein
MRSFQRTLCHSSFEASTGRKIERLISYEGKCLDQKVEDGGLQLSYPSHPSLHLLVD